MPRHAPAAGCLLLFAAVASWGGPAGMVRDIRTEAGLEWGPFQPDEYAEIDGVVFFAADDGVHGRELWRWEPGREPAMLADLCPGVCASRPNKFAVFDGELFFAADDGTHGQEPWLSDGSAGGTRLIRDIAPGRQFSNPDFPVVFQGSLYFTAGGSAPDDRELWRSDGTALGTERILDIEPGPVGSDPSSLTVFADRLYFTAGTSGTGRELWSSDGTAGGTALVLDHCPGPCDGLGKEQWLPFGVRDLQVFDRRLLVLARSFGPSELYVLESRPPALSLLGPEVGNALAPFPQLGDRFFFYGCDALAGCELWSSDGTPLGTSLVADIQPGAAGSKPLLLGVLGSELLFFADDGSAGSELWKTDGTEAGTELVADIAAGSASSTPVLDRFPGLVIDGRMVFRADDGVHGDELWTTDGTTGGTELLLDVWPGPVTSQTYGGYGKRIVVNGSGLISALNLTVGFATWATDGTPEGTALFLDANQQASAIELEVFTNPPNLRAGPLAEDLLFAADDGVHGREVWITDGSAGGTRLVADLAPGDAVPGWPQASYPVEFLDGGGIGLIGAGGGVWSTDADGAETAQLSTGNLQSPFLPLPRGGQGGLFVQSTPGNSSELLATDGTPEGTETLVPGAHGAPAILGESLLVFPRDTLTWGSELWAYPLPDGPAVLLQDIYPGTEGSRPEILGRLGDEILFAATDPLLGRELWATDGSPGGTRLVHDIAPGPLGSSPVVPAYGQPAPVTSRGLFFVADDGQTGTELWVSDGQERGTQLVTDVRPGAVSSGPDQAVAAGERVFFVADDGVHGRELWVVEGAGARLVRDILPGSGSSMPFRYAQHQLVAVGQSVYLGAADGEHGMELWVSDGSHAGTRLLQDIHPGPGSSSPAGFVTAGQRIYFAATDGVHGFELWSLRQDFEVFADGFESGDTSLWSVTVP